GAVGADSGIGGAHDGTVRRNDLARVSADRASSSHDSATAGVIQMKPSWVREILLPRLFCPPRSSPEPPARHGHDRRHPNPQLLGRYCGQLPAFRANNCRIDEMVGDSNVAVGGADVIRSSYCAKTRSFGANATRLAMITVAATPPSTFLRRSVTTESSSATH